MAEAENPPRPPNTQPQQRDANNSNSNTHGGSSSSMTTRRNAALEALREASTRIEAAEAELAKERETARAEAHRRREAAEAEAARLAEDALQRIAGIIGKGATGRKRKRTGEADEEKLVSLREGALLLGLLQCNLFL